MNIPVNDEKILADAGLKITKARSAVIRILSSHDTPLDVSEICASVSGQNIRADQATIYRMLNTFVDKKLVSRVEFQEGKFRYELQKSDHHHIVCERCGAVADVNDCPMGDVDRVILKTQKFTVTRHSLEFFGICGDCRNKQQAS